MEFKIKLSTVDHAIIFSSKCSEFEEDIDYKYNRYIVNAKSLIGVISTGLEHICTVKIHTENEETINNFKDKIKYWIL